MRQFPGASFLDFDDDNQPTAFPGGTNNVTLASISGINLIYDTNNNDSNGFMIAHGNPNSGIATAVLVTDENGNIGIGTDNPSQKLHIEHDGYHQILLKRVGGAPSEVALKNQGNFAILSNNLSGIDFQTGSTPSSSMLINHSGNVGIGTDNPSQKLDIHASDPRIQLIDTDLTTNRSIQLRNHQGSAILSAPNHTSFYNGGDERVRIESGGNVGIGTNDPDSLLTVGADKGFKVPAVGTIIMNRNMAINTVYPIIQLIDTDSNSDFQIQNANGVFGIRDTTNSADRLVIKSDGNVGINSTSPANKLDVRLGAAWIYPDEDGTEAVALKLGKLADFNSPLNEILVSDNEGSSSQTYTVTNKINRYI